MILPSLPSGGNFGAMMEEALLTISNAGLQEWVTSPRYHHRYDERSLPRVIIQRTCRGYGVYGDADGRREVAPDHAFVITLPQEVEYLYPKEASEPWVIDWIDFVGPLAQTLMRGFVRQFGPVIALPRQSTAGICFLRLIERFRSGQRGDRWEESREVYAFVLEWCRQTLRGSDEGRVMEMLRSLGESSAFRPLTVKELAAECGMSREHFTRLFKRQIGIAPAEWLRQRRLEAAARLLSDPTMTLATIARQTGFASGRHLMDAFRRHFGMTTSAYRQHL